MLAIKERVEFRERERERERNTLKKAFVCCAFKKKPKGKKEICVNNRKLFGLL